MTTPTVRRYSRTLSDAFPDERACAIEVHRRMPLGHRVVQKLGAFILIVMLGAIAWGY